MNRQRHICTIVLRSSLQFYSFTRKLIKNKLFTTFVVSLVSSSCSYYPTLFSFYCHYKYFIYLHRNVHYILGYVMTIISFFSAHSDCQVLSLYQITWIERHIRKEYFIHTWCGHLQIFMQNLFMICCGVRVDF